MSYCDCTRELDSVFGYTGYHSLVITTCSFDVLAEFCWSEPACAYWYRSLKHNSLTEKFITEWRTKSWYWVKLCESFHHLEKQPSRLFVSHIMLIMFVYYQFYLRIFFCNATNCSGTFWRICQIMIIIPCYCYCFLL